MKMVESYSLPVAAIVRESLEKGATPFFTITSNSMSPLLVQGDEVGLLPTVAASPQPGDIVVVVTGNTFMTHRFWGRVGEQLVTKGDRSLAFDPPWRPADLLGLVALRRRAGSLLLLREGRGAMLNRLTFALVRLESRVFAGFSPDPLQAQPRERWLGRKLRHDRGFLPARIIRQAFRMCAGLLTGAVAGLRQTDSSSADRPSAP